MEKVQNREKSGNFKRLLKMLGNYLDVVSSIVQFSLSKTIFSVCLLVTKNLENETENVREFYPRRKEATLELVRL